MTATWPMPVAHQRQPALHEVGADDGGRQTGDERGDQGALEEGVARTARAGSSDVRPSGARAARRRGVVVVAHAVRRGGGRARSASSSTARRGRPGRRASPRSGRRAARGGRARARPARRGAAPGEGGQGVGERLLVGRVDAGGRLVEEEQVGLAGQRAGDQHPLLLAAGELGDAVAGARRRARRGSSARSTRPGRRGAAGAAGAGGSADPTVTTSRTEAGTPAVAPGALRHVPDRRQSWKSANGVPKSRRLPPAQRAQPGEGAHQRGLAGPVRPEQRDELALLDASGRSRAAPGVRRSRRRPAARAITRIRSPPRVRPGCRASATGSPRRQSPRRAPRSGRAPRCPTPTSPARRGGQPGAGQPLGEDGGDPLVADEVLQPGEVRGGRLGVGGEAGDGREGQPVARQVAERVVDDHDGVALAVGQPVVYAASRRVSSRAQVVGVRGVLVGAGGVDLDQPSATASARSAIRSGSSQKCGSARRRRPRAVLAGRAPRRRASEHRSRRRRDSAPDRVVDGRLEADSRRRPGRRRRSRRSRWMVSSRSCGSPPGLGEVTTSNAVAGRPARRRTRAGRSRRRRIVGLAPSRRGAPRQRGAAPEHGQRRARRRPGRRRGGRAT